MATSNPLTRDVAMPNPSLVAGYLKTLVWRRIPGVRPTTLSAISGVVRNTPVEKCPALFARLLEIKVPRSVLEKPAVSPSGESNINIIFNLLARTMDVAGDLAECGVFRGASLAALGLYVKQKKAGKMIHGFDSFEGFDDAVQFDINLGGEANDDKRVGGFDETSYENVRQKLARLRLLDNVRLHPGYFSRTLSECESSAFSFVHLDCDIYESYRECLSFFYPRVSPGGIILFDEYNDPPWPGCNLAVDEFLADKPERLELIEQNKYQKWYFVKQ